MIDSAISHISSQLNQFLRRSFELAEDIVVISNVMEQDGNVASHIDNKLVAFLVNIERDSVSYRKPNGSDIGGFQSASHFPPVCLNFYVMFAAHFSGNNYLESLKFLSYTIDFFQRQPIFDHQNTPDLDSRIEKLILGIENLDIRDLSNLWGVLSGKYLPSILYKVRMVTFDADDVRIQVPTVQEPQYTGHP
jgi:hypothetical protein